MKSSVHFTYNLHKNRVTLNSLRTRLNHVRPVSKWYKEKQEQIVWVRTKYDGIADRKEPKHCRAQFHHNCVRHSVSSLLTVRSDKVIGAISEKEELSGRLGLFRRRPTLCRDAFILIEKRGVTVVGSTAPRLFGSSNPVHYDL
jgi:hypothetical protein